MLNLLDWFQHCSPQTVPALRRIKNDGSLGPSGGDDMRRLVTFENRRQPVASPVVFYSRVTRNVLWSLIIVALSLLTGSLGYVYFEGMGAVDAFANAAMILSGMGPLSPLVTDGGKIFAALYAIVSGFMLLGLAGLMLAPVFHRILHSFHVDEADLEEVEPKPSPAPGAKE
jgi:hypothetical protein